MACPGQIEYWRPDEVAECLPVSEKTARRLWEIVGMLVERGEAVPLGGDGSDETVEYPPEPDAYLSGKMVSCWRFLSPLEQADVEEAVQKEFGR